MVVPVSVDLGVGRYDIVSMMVMCHDTVVTNYNRRRPGLSNAPVIIERGRNRIEE